MVLAMGPWSKSANSWLGFEISVEPQKGELLYIDEAKAGLSKPPVTMHNMDDGGVIFPRRISPTILGATKEDGRGFDREPSDYPWEFIIPRVQRLSARIDKSMVSHQTGVPASDACRRQTLRRSSTRLGQRLHRLRPLVRGCPLWSVDGQIDSRVDHGRGDLYRHLGD